VRDYQEGQTVFYSEDASSYSREQGTVVAKSVRQGECVYVVQLHNRVIHTTNEYLAPILKEGDEILYRGEEAEVEEIYASQWPPRYMVRTRDSNAIVETQDDDLSRIQSRSHSEATQKSCDAVAKKDDASNGEEAAAAEEEHYEVTDIHADSQSRKDGGDVEAKQVDMQNYDVLYQNTAPANDATDECEVSLKELSEGKTNIYDSKLSPAAMAYQGVPMPGAVFKASRATHKREKNGTNPDRNTQHQEVSNVKSHSLPANATYVTDAAVLLNAKKLIKEAGSCLDYDDVETCITKLQKSLRMLYE